MATYCKNPVCGHSESLHTGVPLGGSECIVTGCYCQRFQKPPPPVLNRCLNCGHGWVAHEFNETMTSFVGCSVERKPEKGITKWCACGVFRSEYGGPEITRDGPFPA